MEKQTITIYDVAREANVSMATVSRVVNGNPNVKPATRKRFWKSLSALTIDQMQLPAAWLVRKPPLSALSFPM